ncbi:hypothetical protein [Bailinhaonella thermotolerans]|uniref:Uncharacterized protein n=1 Tax=Bailinhaonella thermotolerans TaxID=1070861 RepID=A0A3A4A272_9ACTN|nr:hypothetical protein [Bailinhaonella thermotolerans]RJL22776.1 hypothetical protein D5H75_34880 [Bailinhaonella thermotolerans]
MGQDDFGHLERLVAELDSQGLLARIVRTRSGRPFVRVINPIATTLAENVTYRSQDFWWSWGERMHRGDDPAGAATKVAHVLAAVE